MKLYSLVIISALHFCYQWHVKASTIRRLVDQSYDVNQWPSFNSTPAEPTLVYVDIFINSFGTPKAATMDYQLDVYLRQEWKDARLNFSGDSSQVVTISEEALVAGIWRPDIYFLNLKDAKIHRTPHSNLLLRVRGDGSVFFSMRLMLTLSCHMDLSNYPLDVQKCPIKMSTYAYPSNALVFSWSQNRTAISTGGNLVIPQFTLASVRTEPSEQIAYFTGNFSSISAVFSLQRQYAHHVLQTYIPTVLIVAISWVSFWLEQTSTPARVTLGVTTLLTLTSLAAGVRVELPPVSYLKAIDVWIGVCMLFVFGALLEFVLVHYLAKKRRRTHADRPKSMRDMFFSLEDGSLATPASNHPCPTGTPLVQRKHTYIMQAKVVDRMCRVIVPLLFALFNILYWTVYNL